MLVGLDGGQSAGQGVSAAQALQRYAEEQPAADAAESGWRTVALLEIIGTFIAEDSYNLLAPLVGRRGSAAGGPERADPLEALSAGGIVPALGPCVRLFPYHALVGSGIIAALPVEARRLARWLVEQGHADRDGLARFERALEQAGPALRRHLRLQEALDEACQPFLTLEGGERVLGRFLVTGCGGRRLGLTVPPSGRSYSVVLPGRAGERFREGQAVSMVLQRLTVGWLPLSSSLPTREPELEALVAEMLPPEPRDRWRRG
jgi:hypothetical protein